MVTKIVTMTIKMIYSDNLNDDDYDNYMILIVKTVIIMILVAIMITMLT